MDLISSPFESLYTAYYEIADKIVNQSIQHLISSITPVILIGLTLYILITGYMVIAGRIQDPISDILIKLTKWTIIAFIALEASTITSYLIGGFNGLEQTILQGFGNNQSQNVFQTLDNTLQDGLIAAAKAQAAKNGLVVFGYKLDLPDPATAMIGLFTSIIIMIAVVTQTFIAGAIILLAKISLLVVFALAPLMLSGLFFPQTSRFADSWFNQCFNYILTGVIAAFFATIGSELFESAVNKVTESIEKNDAFPIAELGVMCLIAVVNFFVIKQSPNIASGLAGGVASGSASLIGAARAMDSVGKGIGTVGGTTKSTIGNTAKFAHNKLYKYSSGYRSLTNRVNQAVHRTNTFKRN